VKSPPHLQSPRRWVIGAGAAWNLADAPEEATHTEWFDRRYEQGFELSPPFRGERYLLRHLALADLADQPMLKDQAQSLATWALETWAILESDPA
jgi:hypothetical protein